MGSSNFLQHNPPGSNQENDSQYATDATRTGGIVVDQLIPSPWMNKVLFQSSTFVAALGQALATKGYVLSDANLNTLASVLFNIVTQADLANSPALGGVPTSPTPAPGDNSTKIATTAFVEGMVSAPNLSNPGSINIGGLIIQWGTFSATIGTPTGGSTSAVSFPVTFPNAVLSFNAFFHEFVWPIGALLRATGVTTSGFSYFWDAFNANGNGNPCSISWLAIGF